MKLIKPDMSHLASYRAALEQGWSPDNLRASAAKEALARIAKDPEGYVASLDDPEAKGGPVVLPDGSTTQRLPGMRRWIISDGFCGHIGFRWQPGSADLPPTCSGHIGYSVVPWRQREGMATSALRKLLPEAWGVGLAYVDITTHPDNLASRRVVEKAGGVMARHFKAPQSLGGHDTVLYRVHRPE